MGGFLSSPVLETFSSMVIILRSKSTYFQSKFFTLGTAQTGKATNRDIGNNPAISHPQQCRQLSDRQEFGVVLFGDFRTTETLSFKQGVSFKSWSSSATAKAM
jgi:hypothetical protein